MLLVFYCVYLVWFPDKIIVQGLVLDFPVSAKKNNETRSQAIQTDALSCNIRNRDLIQTVVAQVKLHNCAVPLEPWYHGLPVQINLHIHVVWSEPSPSPWVACRPSAICRANNIDSSNAWTCLYLHWSDNPEDRFSCDLILQADFASDFVRLNDPPGILP